MMVAFAVMAHNAVAAAVLGGKDMTVVLLTTAVVRLGSWHYKAFEAHSGRHLGTALVPSGRSGSYRGISKCSTGGLSQAQSSQVDRR